MSKSVEQKMHANSSTIQYKDADEEAKDESLLDSKDKSMQNSKKNTDSQKIKEPTR